MTNNVLPLSRPGAGEARALCFGLLSVACGGAMLAAPRLFGALFSLPRNRSLVLLLGARDVLIGGALLVPASRRTGLALRALADATDGAMIASEVARKNTTRLHGALSVVVAAASAATAMRLALRNEPAH